MKMDYVADLLNNKDKFFRFMSNKYPVYYKSNIFLRDVQFAVKDYYDIEKAKLTYTQCETIAKNFMLKMLEAGEVFELSHQSWKFLYQVSEAE